MIGSLFLGWAAPPASFSVPCHLKYEAPVLFWPLGYNFGGLAFLAIFDSLNFFRLKIDQKAAQQTEKLTLFFLALSRLFFSCAMNDLSNSIFLAILQEFFLFVFSASTSCLGSKSVRLFFSVGWFPCPPLGLSMSNVRGMCRR